MKRFSLIPALVCAVSSGAFAQEAATGGQAAPASSGAITNLAPTVSTGATLTPPPDNAPSAGAPPAATTPAAAPTTTTTTTSTTTVTGRTSTSTPMSAREIARVQQQAIIRRQELIFQANEKLAQAQKDELATDYPHARANYLFAAQAYGSISHSSPNYVQAAEGLARVDFQLYDSAWQTGDSARAKLLMDEVVTYNPNNKIALDRQAKTDRAIANPNDTSLLGNPAITPGFVRRVNEVQQLFAEAEQFRRTGQWDEAESRLKHILGIDPYNIAATKELEIIDAEKYKYSETARLQTRAQRLREVEEKWYEPINNPDIKTSAQEEQPILKRATTFDVDQKLKGIFIPSLDFSNATIEEATNFLHIESQRLDEPDHKGVSFIIEPAASAQAKPITLSLTNIPVGEALRYVCQLANVKFKVQDYAISIVPVTASTEDLVSRTFIIQPSFIAPPASTVSVDAAAAAFDRRPVEPTTTTAAPDTSTEDPVRAALEAKGVKFTATGSGAVYTPTTGQLTVVDTADQMEFIEELVNAGQAPTLMVRIATKFVEINQTDLNDLTVNTAFNIFDPFAVASSALGAPVSSNGDPVKTPHFSTNLRGSAGITSDSIDALINPLVVAPNTLAIRGFLTGYQFNAVFSALSQKKSMDVLSEPAALTKSGEQATLEAIRVFPYPVAFDPPELVTQQNNSGGVGTVFLTINPPTVIPTTPTDFKRRNIGVRLVVKPQVTADNRTVDLSLFPEVTDFDGFINYGSTIFVGNPDGTSSFLSANVIQQPVFDTRRINTKVLIRDGSTVVLGGLIREDVQTINDKVPILGDLPLIGRLFQSKATQTTARNLIIFVTANIYRNDGELLNPPEVVDAADVLTGHAQVLATPTP